LFLLQPDLMISLGMILSEFPDEPYLVESYGNGAVRRWRHRDLSL